MAFDLHKWYREALGETRQFGHRFARMFDAGPFLDTRPFLEAPAAAAIHGGPDPVSGTMARCLATRVRPP